MRGCKQVRQIDDNVLRNIDTESEQFSGAVGQRDYQYLKVLLEYNIHQHKTNQMRRAQQWVFFGVTMLILVVIVAGAGFIVYKVLQNEVNWAGLGAIAAAAATVIGSIITLPKIVAKNLFPSDGNSVEVDLIKVISDYDLQNTTGVVKQGEDLD